MDIERFQESKAYISSHSNLHKRPCTIHLKHFVLVLHGFKTKNLRCLVLSFDPMPRFVSSTYRKHWKSCVSFQLSGQIRLIWAVRYYSPNWKQFSDVRHTIIFKLIFKNYQNQRKLGSLFFKPKNECWF